MLMGSLTNSTQVDLEKAMASRNAEFNVHHEVKARRRVGLHCPGVHENADSWWKK